MAAAPNSVDFQGGFAKLCLPDTPARKGCFIAGLIIILFGAVPFSIGVNLPDIGLVEDAQTWNSIDSELELSPLGDGINGEGAWVLSHIWLQEGHLGDFDCVANELSTFFPNYSSELKFSFVDDPDYIYYNATTNEKLGLYGDTDGDCSDTVAIEGTNEIMWRVLAHMALFYDSNGTLNDVVIVSIFLPYNDYGFEDLVKEGYVPLDDTSRTDLTRFGLFSVLIGMTFVVFSTPKPLEHVLRKFQREGKREILDIKFDENGARTLTPANGLERNSDENDWIFEPPSPGAWNLDDPYQPDDNETLIDEHPSRNGKFSPPMITNRSVFIMIWWLVAISLCDGLLFKDNDPYTAPVLAYILLAIIVITLFNYVPNSVRKWRRFHALKDLPTSTVRGAAVGPVELVGQVRPSPSGAATITVNGKTFSGIVAWRILTAGPDGMRIIAGSKPFILHDGTGGVLVDPSTWFWGESDSMNGQQGNVKFLHSELHLGRSLSGVPFSNTFNFELDMEESYQQDQTKVLRTKRPGGFSRFMMELLHGSESKGKKGLLGKIASKMVDLKELQREREAAIERAHTLHESGELTDRELADSEKIDMSGEFSELYALAIGDPAYVLGTARARSAEEVEDGVSTANQSSLLVVTGDEAPGIFPRIGRGSELTTSKDLISDFEFLVPPFLATAMTILLFIL